MVQTQALNNNDIPQERIAAVVLFGNPYFRPGLTQDNCGAVSLRKIPVVGPRINDGLSNGFLMLYISPTNFWKHPEHRHGNACDEWHHDARQVSR
jgi:hypothetical protein